MKVISLFLFSLFLVTADYYAQATTIKLPTTDNTSSFNITNSSNTVMLKLNADAGFYLGGTYGSGSIPIEGAGSRLMWYPKESAFRAGYVESTQWDDSTIGIYSVATGRNTKASGSSSTAMGNTTIASGNSSTAMGNTTIASGSYSTAMGFVTKASGHESTAMGFTTTASGYYSTAMGYITTASGDGSTAMGISALASGNYSVSMGYNTTAQAYSSLVLGRYNVITGTTGSWVAAEPVLVVGNGTGSAARSNALTLLKNGNMTIAGTLTENSDMRLKENITPLKNVLSSFEKITPVYYNFIDKQSHPSSRQIGLLAQEIEPLFPELISKDSQGFLSLDYSKMTSVLLKAIKEQQIIINEKADELKKAENKIAYLEKELSEQNIRISVQQIMIEKLENNFNEIKEAFHDQSWKKKEAKANFSMSK